MYSSEDLERFYFQYQTEAYPNGISIQDFCVKNKVTYNIFFKWYKDTRKRIVEVKLDGCPPEGVTAIAATTSEVSTDVASSGCTTRIWVELRVSNGLHVSRKNLTYQELTRVIEKLEGLC